MAPLTDGRSRGVAAETLRAAGLLSRGPARYRAGVITGTHAILYAEDAEAARAFCRDVLGLPYVDTGGGWLIFRLPPAEVGVHPPDGAAAPSGRHELFLTCDDVHATVAELRAKGATFSGEVVDHGWGLLITLEVPGGGSIGLYEPKHAGPPDA